MMDDFDNQNATRMILLQLGIPIDPQDEDR